MRKDREVKPLICLHCGREPANRPRGLGYRCFYTPGVRAQYPPTDLKFAYRGYGVGNSDPPAPACPTTAAPGSPNKVAVLADRAAAGRALHHPADSRFPGDPRPLLFFSRGS